MKLKDGQSNEVAIKKEAGAVAAINIEKSSWTIITTSYTR